MLSRVGPLSVRGLILSVVCTYVQVAWAQGVASGGTYPLPASQWNRLAAEWKPRFEESVANRLAGRFDEALATLTVLTSAADQSKDPFAVAVFLRQIADIHYANRRLDQALETIDQALAKSRSSGDSDSDRAYLLAAKGGILLDLDRTAEARTAYEAAETARETSDDLLGAMAAAGGGLVLRIEGQFAGERELLTRHLLAIGNSDSLARLDLLVGLAGSHAAAREFAEARSAADQASQLLSSLEKLEQSRKASLLADLGVAYFEMGMKVQAQRQLRAALAAAVAAHEPLLLDNVRLRLALSGVAPGREQSQELDIATLRARPGYLRLLAREFTRAGENYLELGRFAEALLSLRGAARLFETVSDSAGMAETWSSLADAYLRLGRADLASDLLDRAEALASGLSTPQLEMRVLWYQGLAHMEMVANGSEHLEKANRAFDRMRAFAEAASDPIATTEALSALAEINDLRADSQTALSVFTRARQSATRADPVTRARLLNRFGEALARSGDWAASERTLREGLDALRNTSEFRAEVSVLMNLGTVLERRGNPTGALTCYLRAVNTLEDARPLSGASGFTARLTAPGGDPYQAAIRLLMRANNPREAFGIAERSRSLPLLGDADASYIGFHADLLEERDLLWLERRELRHKVDLERSRSAPDQPLLEQFHRREDSLAREYGDLTRRLTAGSSGLPVPQRTHSALSIDQVQAQLPDDTALLSYFAAGDVVYGFAARRSGFVGFEVALPAQELARLISLLPGGSLEASRDALTRLYQALLAPARRLITAHTIAVEPSGVLHSLPFGALLDGGSYLLDTHRMFAVPSATSLVFPPKAAPGGGGLLVVADRGSAEAAEVSRAWYGESAPPVASSAEALRARAPRSAVLHIASPIALDSAAPLLSSIPLHSDSGAGQKLEMVDVRALDLGRVGLVVLGAPQSAAPADISGEDFRARTQAFLEAGAAAVVAGAWPVPDEARRALLRDFYGRLADHQDKAEALRQAQLRLRDSFPWPGVWAALQLAGNPGAMDDRVTPDGSGVRLTGVLRTMEWPFVTMETADHSQIRVRLQSQVRLVQGDEDAAPAALQPGTAVSIAAAAGPDSSFSAVEVEILSSGAASPRASAFINADSDPLLSVVAATAAGAIEKLPDFTCRQQTSRSASHDSGLTWTYHDAVSADVIYSGHEEVYTNIQHGTSDWKRGILDFDGYTTSGEYGTVLRNLFRPAEAARFRFRGPDTLDERPVLVYDFWIDQPNSDWELNAAGHKLSPAYHGTVWIDPVDLWVLRIRHEADDELPPAYPWRSVSGEITFGRTTIPDVGTFLLPKLGTSVICERQTNECHRNQIEFRDYLRYQATSAVRFEEVHSAPQTETAASGALTWTGTLRPFELLEIRDGSAKSGSLSGSPFPGTGITVSVAAQVSVLDRPGPSNGWKRLLLRNGTKPLKQIEIRWERIAR